MVVGLLSAVVLLARTSCQRASVDQDAERLCRKALKSYRAGDWRKAKALFERAARLRPDWFVPQWALSGQDDDIILRDPDLDEQVDALLDSVSSSGWAARLVWRVRRDKEDRALRRATKVVPDPWNLFREWADDPKCAALYEQGYRLFRAQCFRQAADKFEEGLTRCQTYTRGYGMLLRASARLNEWQRGLERLRTVAATEWLDLLDHIGKDKWLVAQLRHRRPVEWRVPFTSYYFTDGGWRTKPPQEAEPPYSDRTPLAARKGILWTFVDRSDRTQTEHGPSPTCLVWRHGYGRWRPFLSNSQPNTISITGDGRVWLCSKPRADSPSLQVLRGNRFISLNYPHCAYECFGVVDWRGEVWICGGAGLLRHGKGRSLFYQWADWWGVSPDIVTGPLQKGTDGSLVGKVVLPNGGLGDLRDELCTDRQNRLWHGERLFDGIRFALPHAPLLAWRRRCIVDTAGRLWGPEEGFWRESKGGGDILQARRSPNLLVVDAKRRLWHGTNGSGLVLWDGHRLTFFTTEDGLSGNIVRSLALDGDTLWVGTERGVSCVRVPWRTPAAPHPPTIAGPTREASSKKNQRGDGKPGKSWPQSRTADRIP